MEPINIGWAQTSITPQRPLLMIGQMYHRVSEYVHDPITATALALESGKNQAIFVSLDMTEIPLNALPELRALLAGQQGLDFDAISFNVTHTHNASDFFADFMRLDNEHVYGAEILPPVAISKEVLTGEAAQQYFLERIADVITRAWNSRKPGGICAAHDYATVGFCRRPVFGGNQNEETIMYGDCSRGDFQRFESGADASADMLYTWDMEGRLTGVVVDIPCPAQVFELHRFITADYWCYTRNSIREALGGVYVLPLCGAAGDLSPLDLVRISKDNKQALVDWGGQTKEVLRNFDMTLECQGIASRITEAVVRGYKTARNYIDYSPAFAHRVLKMELPLRLVSREDYETAIKTVQILKQRFSADHPMEMSDVVQAFEPQGVVLRWELQQKSEVYEFVCHIVRIADVGIVTNPFELYSEFAQRMKARVKARQLFVVQLANGLGGYLPTETAVQGGSYSSKPASTTCGPEGGDILVEKTICEVNSLFN
ncbi:MAG: hypothetical protein RRZ24_10220 [Clostridia bacterium]